MTKTQIKSQIYEQLKNRGAHGVKISKKLNYTDLRELKLDSISVGSGHRGFYILQINPAHPKKTNDHLYIRINCWVHWLEMYFT